MWKAAVQHKHPRLLCLFLFIKILIYLSYLFQIRWEADIHQYIYLKPSAGGKICHSLAHALPHLSQGVYRRTHNNNNTDVASLSVTPSRKLSNLLVFNPCVPYTSIMLSISQIAVPQSETGKEMKMVLTSSRQLGKWCAALSSFLVWAYKRQEDSHWETPPRTWYQNGHILGTPAQQ